MCESVGASERFEINSYKKDNLLNGYDDIDFLNNIKTDIQKFASNTPL
jgi:3-isopropylmalate/(R)-2-methylmalate dehydratase small subunit